MALHIDQIIKETIAQYYYNTSDNKYSYLKCRKRLPDGTIQKGLYFHCVDAEKKQWEYGLNGNTHLLYKLPELLEGIKAGKRVFFVEGEKDVDTLTKLGEVATTSGSNTSWKPEFAEHFKGAVEVIILPDQDAGGQTYGELARADISKIVSLTYIVNVPEGKDISDFLQVKKLEDLDPFIEIAKQSRRNQIDIEEFNADVMPGKYTDPLPLKNEDIPLPMTVQDVKNSIGNIETNPVIDNLLYRESISFLFGDPGSCKTWLTLDLCFNLADGNTVWGQFETSPKKVLFFEGDFTLPILKYRFDRFKENANQDNFLSLNTEQFHEKKIEYLLETPAGKELFERYLQKFNPDLVVIDSLGEFTGIDESKQKEMKNVIDFLKIMAKKYSNHILVLHHSRKRSNNERQERQMDMSDMTGSYVISRYASTIFCINPIFDEEGKVPNKGLVVNVKNWFRNINRFEFALTETEEETVSITYNSEVVTSHKSKTQQCKDAILNLLKSDPTGFSQKQIVNTTGFNQRLIGEVLRELVKENKIKAIGETTRRIYKISFLHELLHDTREVCKSVENNYTRQGKDSSIGNVRVMEELNNNNNNNKLLHDSYISTCKSYSLTGQGKELNSYIDTSPCKSECNNPEEKILCKNCNNFPLGCPENKIVKCGSAGKEITTNSPICDYYKGRLN